MPRLERLEIDRFRCHTHLQMELGECAWVLLEGSNGAGKTSILEAIFTVLRGKSFRTRRILDQIAQGEEEAQVLIWAQSERLHQLGLSLRSTRRLQHVDGKIGVAVAEIITSLPTLYLGAKSYELISASPTYRRQFLDWGAFHVEPSFIQIWRRWRRAHRQRNRGLRTGVNSPALSPWTVAMAEYGQILTQFRVRQVERINQILSAHEEWRAIFSGGKIQYKQGWEQGSDLLSVLEYIGKREEKLGQSLAGPHLDDWVLMVEGKEARNLSRGQQKLAGMWLWRAQCQLLSEAGRAPILLLDDLVADLDRTAWRQALRALSGVAGQIWVSFLPELGEFPLWEGCKRFHVEPGKVIMVAC